MAFTERERSIIWWGWVIHWAVHLLKYTYCSVLLGQEREILHLNHFVCFLVINIDTIEPRSSECLRSWDYGWNLTLTFLKSFGGGDSPQPFPSALEQSHSSGSSSQQSSSTAIMRGLKLADDTGGWMCWDFPSCCSMQLCHLLPVPVALQMSSEMSSTDRICTLKTVLFFNADQFILEGISFLPLFAHVFTRRGIFLPSLHAVIWLQGQLPPIPFSQQNIGVFLSLGKHLLYPSVVQTQLNFSYLSWPNEVSLTTCIYLQIVFKCSHKWLSK